MAQLSSKRQLDSHDLFTLFSIINDRIYNIQNMLSVLAKLFIPLSPSHSQVYAEINNVLLKVFFFAFNDLGKQQEVLLALTDNFLIVSLQKQPEEVNLFCPLDFDLKFQVLRKDWLDEKTPGAPVGIRFEKGSTSTQNSVEFFLPNTSILHQWISVLSKKINQRNFHKLFRAKKKIGKGAFATVYLAQRLIDGKMVAVKAFSKEKQYSGDKGRESLENEIKIMRSVNHPNITSLEQVYETDNSIYVILQYLEGKQLNDEIKNGKKFSPQESMLLIKQILMALEHLSQRRIIHRDLKPENIIFKYENSLEICICDLGLATYADETQYLFVRCGTPGFVAPEIINIKDMTTKSQPISDVFSAGIIFHTLIMGRSVFPGKKYNDVLAQNRACDFHFNTEQYQNLPIETRHLLISMLEKDPSKRISAQQALCLNYFHNWAYLSTEMQIEQKKEKPFFMQINFNQVSGSKNANSLLPEKMIDQNQNANTFCLGKSVKKKISINPSSTPYGVFNKK